MAWTQVRPPRLPWQIWLLLAYLAGITIIGKGPTYLGYPPIYFGEIVMVAGLYWITLGRRPEARVPVRLPALSAAVALFMLVGFCSTVAYLPTWGMDAVRDAAMWYYALFYFIGLGISRFRLVSDRLWKILRVIWVLALIWGAANYLSGTSTSNSDVFGGADTRLSQVGPVIPWRGVTLFYNQRDEIGQNCALGALLVLCLGYPRHRPRLRYLLIAMACLGLSLFAASEGRGVRVGFVASAAVGLLLLGANRPRIIPARRLLGLAAVAVPVLVALLLLVPDFARVAQFDRFGEENASATQNREWRAIWWNRLVDEVIRRNPAFGIGFGEGLKAYHPQMAHENSGDWDVRSPHNYHVSVLVRMGFVGLAIWLTILVLGVGTLFVRVWQGRCRRGPYRREQREELMFWLMMLVFTVVNSSFGVLMEGPVLGIWFWFALGFSLGRSVQSDSPRSGSGERLMSSSSPERIGAESPVAVF